MGGLNVVLTGVPRSGTTLVCHLLNKVPDTLALHEPLDPETVARAGEREAMCDAIERFFAETRESVRTRGTARSQQLGGRVPDNPADDVFGPEGLRASRMASGEIRVDPTLSERFVLVVKHNAMFTALMDTLRERFPCYAVVRNPLAALASWNTVAMPVQDGHAPAAERIDQELARALGRLGDRTARQLHLLSWFHERYRTLLPVDRVLRYEDVLASRGRVLAAVAPGAARLDETMSSKNANPLYDPRVVADLGERLLRSEGAYWSFYSRESVGRLMTDVLACQ